MALLYFTEQQVDYAIMEVGMGGSIDSTNVIQPEIAVITNVAMDHMAYLGNTPVEIAQVKAGIIKSGCITITGAKDPAVLQVIQAAAQEKDSHLLIINQDFGWQNRQFDGELQHFDYWEQNGPTILLETKMLGEHQLDNAALAVAAANSLGITPAVIQVGIQEMIWPGRLEIMQKRPLIVIDGAHNHHGMLALKQALQEYWPQKHIIAVIGMLADKEREAALGELLPFIETAIITKVPNARAGNWQYISTLCQKAKIPCQEIEDVSAACQVAVAALNQQFASDQDVMLLVTGSLYMIAEARTYFLQQDE